MLPPRPSHAPRATLLIRLMVGATFLAEGVQKFLFPGEVGAGRFARIGLPNAELLGPFRLRELPYHGVWGFAHEARTDFAMVMGSLFLLLAGAGPWSLDARLARRPSRHAPTTRRP